MKKIFTAIKEFFSAPLQVALVISFSLIAAITILIGAWGVSQTIGEYLTSAMNDRVARDMQLAQAFYNLKLREIEGITFRISQDPLVIENIHAPKGTGENPYKVIKDQISTNLSSSALGGNHVIAVLDTQGNLLAGNLLAVSGQQIGLEPGTNWASLDVVQSGLSSGNHSASTEIIPAEFLALADLADQARINILDTPKANPVLFDSREGTAGLALMSISPIRDKTGQMIGLTVAFHLLNNDFTLVDRIKAVAGIDTVTIFLGDLRVSTNVRTLEGERAIGTRVSQEVGQVVLAQNQEFVGPAFVVNQQYITRYDPLKNRLGQVIGILYVGSKQAGFQSLVNAVNQRIVLVAFATILLAFLIAVPVSRIITRPLNQLKDLVAANRSVAAGDLTVRVPVNAGGEVGLLTDEFNLMLDTLQSTQDQLVQSEKLASLGQLAAGVAHELNNPLGTILLYSDLILKDTPPGSPQRADLEVIMAETKRCKSIVAALLEFARQNQLAVQSVDLNSLIQTVIDVEKKHHPGMPVEIIYTPEAELPKIQADPAQLQQVMYNLVDNSLDAMPDGGRVSIQTRTGPAGMVTIELEDTGTGITPENLSKLFTPFFTTKPMGKGTGLGLPIVYGIVKLHRGQINARSEIGKGTAFTIQLPIKLLGINNSNK